MALQETDDSGSLSDHEATYHGRGARRGVDSARVSARRTDAAETVDPAADAPARPDPAPVSTDAEIEAAEAAVAEASDPNLRYADQPKEKTPRHRAKSQQARPEDVPEIQALSRTLKEKQDELGKYRPANGNAESPRVTALRRQIRGLEAEIDEARPKPTPAKVEPIAAPMPSSFTEPEPSEKDFPLEKFTGDDPYGARVMALARAVAAWDRRKEAFEARIEAQKHEATAGQKALEAKLISGVEAFAAKTPDFQTVVATIPQGEQPPPLLGAAITSQDGDKYPEFVYYLAQHPDVRAEMHFLTDGKQVTAANVASARRILERRMQADPTGAVAPSVPVRRPPVPPTPVRTGPLKTGDDAPDDAASLADHESYYHKRRR